MAREISWTEAAWSDLEQAAGYISQGSPAYAAALVRETLAAARTLDRFAERGRYEPEVQDVSIRELFVSSYRLIYQVRPTGIYIVAMVHGARDLAALWQREGLPGGPAPQ